MAEDMNVMAVDTDEGVSITNRGTAFLGKVQAGLAEAEFTKVKVGTGLRPEETDPMEMTQLVNYKMDALIKEVGYDEDSNDSFVTLQLKNTSITENFVLTEAGIYVNDPDIGEILYGYIDFQNKPIPVIAGTQGVESFECKLHVYTSNVQTFTAILSPLSDVSRQEFDTEINGLKNPVFDDSGEVENITNFSSFLSTLVSGMSIFQFFRNLKAGLKFVMDVGMTVNNLESDSPTLPLSAAQGKALKGMFDQLNADKALTLDLTDFNLYTMDSTTQFNNAKTQKILNLIKEKRPYDKNLYGNIKVINGNTYSGTFVFLQDSNYDYFSTLLQSYGAQTVYFLYVNSVEVGTRRISTEPIQ